MVLIFFSQNAFQNHFVGSLQPFCSGVGLGASTLWLPQPNPLNSEGDGAALPMIILWPGFTSSLQAQYFREMGWKNRKTHWYEAVSSEVHCVERSLAELLRF